MVMLNYRPGVCREPTCKASIAFVRTRKGNLMPVNIESLSESDINSLEHGEEVQYRYKEHVPHHPFCPGADKFRKNKSAREVAPDENPL